MGGKTKNVISILKKNVDVKNKGYKVTKEEGLSVPYNLTLFPFY